MSELGWILVTVAIVVAGIGLIWLIQRSSQQQQKTGRPSYLIRVLALVLGVVVAGSMLLMGYFSLQLGIAAVVLLGYGLFGLFSTVKRQPAAGAPSQAQAHIPVQYPQVIGSLDAPKKTFWQRFRIPIIGCGGLLVLIVVGYEAYTLWIWQDRGELNVTAEYPHSVAVGDEFDVVLRLSAPAQKTVLAQHIVFDAAYGSDKESILTGAQILSTEPLMDLDPAAASLHGYLYNREVKPGETHVIKLHMKALKAGEYHTDFFVLLPRSTAAAYDAAISVTP